LLATRVGFKLIIVVAPDDVKATVRLEPVNGIASTPKRHGRTTPASCSPPPPIRPCCSRLRRCQW
jgi:hypothetical protein